MRNRGIMILDDPYIALEVVGHLARLMDFEEEEGAPIKVSGISGEENKMPCRGRGIKFPWQGVVSASDGKTLYWLSYLSLSSLFISETSRSSSRLS